MDYKIDKSILNNYIPYYSVILTSNDIISIYNDLNFSFAKIEPEYEYIDMIKMETNIPLDSIGKKMNKIMKNIQIGNSYQFFGDKYNIKINLLNKFNKNETFIEFLLCKEKLGNLYNYDEIILVLIEIYRDADIWINNKIQYFLYDKNKIEIDLSICKDDNINIHYKINNGYLLNLERISYFDSLGINIFNRADPFFNDICFPYSENNRDMVLQDRIKYIYQNYSICDIGCKYEKVEIEANFVLCNCIPSSLFEQNLEEYKVKELNVKILQNSTLGVIRCYKLVFRFKNKYKNYGFWIAICESIGQLSILIFYIIIGTKPIQKYIENQMEKYHYSINNGEKNNDMKEKNNGLKNIEINNNIKFNENNSFKNNEISNNKERSEKNNDLINNENNNDDIKNKNLINMNNESKNNEKNKYNNISDNKLKIKKMLK